MSGSLVLIGKGGSLKEALLVKRVSSWITEKYEYEWRRWFTWRGELWLV